MSGPIVRKYGFPNFEKIFGERELKHGAEDSATPKAEETPRADGTTTPPSSASNKPDVSPSS